MNLIHFTGPITDAEALCRWVDRHRSPGFVVVCTSLEVVRWDFDGQRMIRNPLASALPR